MDYEQKYEQALENLKRIKNANRDNKELVDFIEYQYPELKESEDENIRKQILDCFRTMKKQGCFPSKHKEQYDSWIAWLEKQSKQSLEEKVNEAMREVEEKAKAFTAKHKGETTEEILAQMRGEQKPAEWSVNDELNFNQAIYVCHQYGYFGVETWLKSLKQRMKGE